MQTRKKDRPTVATVSAETVPAALGMDEAVWYLGMSRSAGYRLVQAGKFPVPVHGGNGSRYWVRGSDIVAALGLGGAV